jgi:hypothetical protein
MQELWRAGLPNLVVDARVLSGPQAATLSNRSHNVNQASPDRAVSRATYEAILRGQRHARVQVRT